MSVIDLTAVQFIDGIADALVSDFGDSNSTVKVIGELTGAAPGTVKKWLAKHNGPGGEMLVKLMAASPAVCRFVDGVTGRADRVARRERQMHRALAILAERDDDSDRGIIEIIPALQADLFERRPAAPSRAERIGDRARAASHGKVR